MPTITFSGLASGLDTSAWVEALVSVKQTTLTGYQQSLEAIEKKPEKTPKEPPLMTPLELLEYQNMTAVLIDRAKEELESAKEEIREEIGMLHARIDLLNERLDMFGDFTGDSDEVMSYISMRVDYMIADQNKPAKTEQKIAKHLRMMERYVHQNFLIAQSSQDNMLAELRLMLHNYKSKQALLKD